jgi:hypothetical protein
MANIDSTQPQLINGFYPVSQTDIEDLAGEGMESVELIETLFATIGRLSNDNEIRELCKHGGFRASILHNDIDVIRERAIKAGLVGYLVA